MEFNEILNVISEKASANAPIDASIKFNMGDQIIHVDGKGDANIVTTEDKKADCVISVSTDNFEKLQNGSLNPMMAVMTGKVKIKGDMGIAMRLQSFIS